MPKWIKRRDVLKKEFPTSALFIEELEDEVLEGVWNAAKNAPRISWFIEEKFGEQWMIWLEPPIFYEDVFSARLVAQNGSLDLEIEALRTMKWTRGTK